MRLPTAPASSEFLAAMDRLLGVRRELHEAIATRAGGLEGAAEIGDRERAAYEPAAALRRADLSGALTHDVEVPVAYLRTLEAFLEAERVYHKEHAQSLVGPVVRAVYQAVLAVRESIMQEVSP